MDMHAIFYENFNKFINSTKRPTGVAGDGYEITLKKAVSMNKPVFLMNVVNYNYNYVSWNDRYYFIDDIVPVANNLCEYHCIYDAMATYRPSIGASTQYVLRSSATFDGNVIDTLYPAKSKITNDRITFDEIHNKMGIVPTGSVLQGGWVIGTANADGSISGGSITYYYLNANAFAQLKAFMFAENPTWLNISSTEISQSLQKALVNPLDYIVSCTWFPFGSTSGVWNIGTDAHVKFGWWDSGITGKVLGVADRFVVCAEEQELPRHPKASTRGVYLNGAPYSRYSLNCYSFGTISLDQAFFVDNDAIHIAIYTDLFTGEATLVVSAREDETTLNPIYVLNGSVGVPIELAQVKRDYTSSKLSFGTSIATSIASAIGVAEGISSALDTMMTQAGISGSNGTTLNYIVNPFVLCEFIDIVDENNYHRGRPLCQDKQISTIPGYILCADAEINFARTPYEKETIKNYLESGFFYE